MVVLVTIHTRNVQNAFKYVMEHLVNMCFVNISASHLAICVVYDVRDKDWYLIEEWISTKPLIYNLYSFFNNVH